MRAKRSQPSGLAITLPPCTRAAPQIGPSMTHAPSWTPCHTVRSLATEVSSAKNSWMPWAAAGAGAATTAGSTAAAGTARVSSSGAATSVRAQDSITVAAVAGSPTARSIRSIRQQIPAGASGSRIRQPAAPRIRPGPRPRT